jgi:hypothetical protein
VDVGAPVLTGPALSLHGVDIPHRQTTEADVAVPDEEGQSPTGAPGKGLAGLHIWSLLLGVEWISRMRNRAQFTSLSGWVTLWEDPNPGEKACASLLVLKKRLG